MSKWVSFIECLIAVSGLASIVLDNPQYLTPCQEHVCLKYPIFHVVSLNGLTKHLCVYVFLLVCIHVCVCFNCVCVHVF